MSRKKQCKDCRAEGVATYRPLKANSGGRCATHHRKNQVRRKENAHEKHLQREYGLSKDQYNKLKDAQDGRCYICRRAKGKTRNLSVDHDHKTGEVRSLLCQPCNRMLGHLRDDPDAFERVAEYLRNPPARNVLEGRRYVPVKGAEDEILVNKEDGVSMVTTYGGGLRVEPLYEAPTDSMTIITFRHLGPEDDPP